MISFGTSGGLEVTLDWSNPVPEGSAGDATRGYLELRVQGRELWPGRKSPDAFEWPWVELLEHLARSWRRLRMELTDPIALGGPVRALLARAEAGWKRAPSRRLTEDALVTDYMMAHDLSGGLNGIDLPSLWIVRSGRLTRLETTETEVRVESSSVFPVLNRLGDEIARRLEGIADVRANDARSAWAARDSRDLAEDLAVLTSWSRPAVTWLASQYGKGGGDPQMSEIAVAARMVGPLDDPKVLAPVFREIRKTPRQETTELDSLAEKARAAISSPARPHEHGYVLARWLRKHLLLRPDDRIQVEPRLGALNVLVKDVELPLKDVDAICAWGPSHGPAIFVNTKGQHSQGKRGRHATLAHELCHLLIDRGTTLTVAEVRGPHAPSDVEARANAFAAELLFPQAAACAVFKGINLDRVTTLLGSLAARYFASESVVAWQALNSGVQLSASVRSELLKRASTYAADEAEPYPVMSLP